MYNFSVFEMIVMVFEKAGFTLWTMAPYVCVGIILGELLRYTPWTKVIYHYINKSPFLSIFISVILGMFSPLCTYGTIPVVLNLFKSGVAVAPLIAFLSVSSLMNPQLFIMTWGGLGIEIAFIRTLNIFLFGLILGLILYLIPDSWIVNVNINKKHLNFTNNKCQIEKNLNYKSFLTNILETLEFVTYYIVLGVIVGAFVEVFIPSQWISSIFQQGRWLSVILAALLGIPLYVCGGGVIPLIRSLIQQGMSKGAALTFLIVGPATRLTPLFALATIIRPAFLAVYLSIVILFSLIVGIIY